LKLIEESIEKGLLERQRNQKNIQKTPLSITP